MDGRHVFQIGGPGWRAWLAFGLMLLAPRRASASPPEVFSELGLHPTDPNRVVLAYAGGGQGLLFSDDGGYHFRLRCGAAVGPSFTKSRSPLALTHDGLVLLGTFGGLLRGGADGCGFGIAPELAAGGVADIAADPRSSDILYLAVREGEGSTLWKRDRDGVLTELRERAEPDAGQPTWLIDRLQVAALPQGALRFYTSGLRAESNGSYTPVLRHSDDGGARWVTRELPAAEGDRISLIAVDPTDPDRVALGVDRDGAPGAVLIGSDGGATLEQRLELHALGAVALAPDGRLWIGDAGGDTEYSQPGGLYVLDDFAAPARQLARWPVRCLDYRALDDTLLGCTRNEFGEVEPEMGTFSARATFETVEAFVSCAGEDLVAACQHQLCDNWCGVLHYAQAPLCEAYDEVSPVCGPAARGYGSEPDSGAPAPVASAVAPSDAASATSLAAPPGPPRPSTSDGCSVGRPPRAPRGGLLALSMLTAVAALRRCRRACLAARPRFVRLARLDRFARLASSSLQRAAGRGPLKEKNTMARTTILLVRLAAARSQALLVGLLGWVALGPACSSEGSPAPGADTPAVDPSGTGTTPQPGASPGPSLPGQTAAGGSEGNPAAGAPLNPGTSAAAVDSDWCRALGVFRENCQSCHGSELRFGAPMPLTSFDELQATSVSNAEQTVAQRVQARIHDAARPMPPGGMPAEDRALLDAWFATGSAPGADATCAGLAPASAPTETPEFTWPSDCEEFYTLTTSSRSNSAEKYVVAAGTEEHPQFIFDAPWGDDEVQVLAYRPITDNARVLHHWILYENDTGLFGGGLGGKFLVGWAPGSPGGTGFPEDVGLYMPNGAGSLRLDVHYYNLGNTEPASDQSGVELCITRTPRPQTATVVGLTGDATARVGRSDNATPCTVNLTGTDAVTFLSVSPHMHKLGVHAKLDLTRSGQTTSLHDAPFDFEDQQIYPLQDVAIRDGDVLTTTCSYENDTATTVRFGQNSDDEMCFNFVTYYPMGAFQCGFSL